MKKSLIVFFLEALCSTVTFAGGPWPQPKGKGYYKLSEWWIVFDEHFTDLGLKDPNVTTGVFNTSLYAEYGITNRLTAQFNGALFSRNTMNNLVSQTTGDIIAAGEGFNSLGDINVGLKYGLTKPGSKLPVALSVMLGLPTGTPVAGELNNLQTGDGEFNQIVQLDAGTGFNIGSSRSYLSAHLGFNNRTNQFSEELLFGGEFGLGLIKNKLFLVAKLNIVESFKNGATGAAVTSTSIFANNAESSTFGVEANLYLTKNLGLSVGTANPFAGEIVAAGRSYSVGVFLDLSK